MNINSIGNQANFKGRFAQEYNTIKILQAVNDDTHCDKTNVKKNIIKLKSFCPDDTYTLNIKNENINGKDYDYLYIQNKRTKGEMAESISSSGGLGEAFINLTSKLLKMDSDKAVNFVSGRFDVVDLALSDKFFDSPRYYGN